jgi:hypothetical protein
LALLGFANLDRFGNQGCTILIIGAGGGGDVIGALSQVGATVICLEPDKAQFPHLVARVKLARNVNGQEKDATFLGQSIVGERGVFAGKKKVAGSQGEADDDCDGNDTQQEVKAEDVECLVCSGSATVSTKGVEDFQQFSNCSQWGHHACLETKDGFVGCSTRCLMLKSLRLTRRPRNSEWKVTFPLICPSFWRFWTLFFHSCLCLCLLHGHLIFITTCFCPFLSVRCIGHGGK